VEKNAENLASPRLGCVGGKGRMENLIGLGGRTRKKKDRKLFDEKRAIEKDSRSEEKKEK